MNQKKKKGLIALVILLVVAIGVGFAASQDAVNINGTASAVATDFDIQFKTDAAITTQKSAGDTIVVSGAYGNDGNADATMTVSGLKNKNDYAEATYTIINKSTDVNADIKATVSSDVEDKDHYKVEVTGGADGVAPDATTTVTVKVTLVKAFADDTTAKTAKSFKITATGTAAE